jgi:hypothetical protein
MIPSQVVSASGAALAVVAVVIALFSVVVLVPVIVVVSNRAEPDPRGLRPRTVFLFGMSFVTLQLAYAGLVLIGTSLFALIAPHFLPLTNTVAREVVIGGLFVVLAGGTWLLHVRRGIETARGEGDTGPNARVMKSYAGVVCFIYFLQMIFALGFAIYLLFELIAPGVFGNFSTSRSGTLAELLDLVYVMVLSGLAVFAHSTLGPSVFPSRGSSATGLLAPNVPAPPA